MHWPMAVAECRCRHDIIMIGSLEAWKPGSKHAGLAIEWTNRCEVLHEQLIITRRGYAKEEFTFVLHVRPTTTSLSVDGVSSGYMPTSFTPGGLGC